MIVVLSLFLAVCVRTALAARYCEDILGRVYQCDNYVSVGVRIAIGISVTIACLIFLAVMLYIRQRRARRRGGILIQPPYNPYSVQSSHPQDPEPAGPKAGGWSETNAGGVSYPPPTHPPSPSGNPQYSPPSGPPPNYEA